MVLISKPFYITMQRNETMFLRLRSEGYHRLLNVSYETNDHGFINDWRHLTLRLRFNIVSSESIYISTQDILKILQSSFGCTMWKLMSVRAMCDNECHFDICTTNQRVGSFKNVIINIKNQAVGNHMFVSGSDELDLFKIAFDEFGKHLFSISMEVCVWPSALKLKTEDQYPKVTVM